MLRTISIFHLRRIKLFLFQQVFWVVKLCVVISTATFMCRHLIVKFFHDHVDTTIIFKPQTEMKLPVVFICGNKMEEMLASQYNCASKYSRSYNKTVCESLQQKCPQFCKDNESDENCSKSLIEQGVTCDKRLVGQCIMMNANGERKQTLIDTKMTYNHKINSSHFPLWIFVKPSGQVELMPTPGVELKWTQINEPGKIEYRLFL